MNVINEINSLSDLLTVLNELEKNWGFSTRGGRPWFRGQTKLSYKPLPGIFRKQYEEVGLTLMFRERASTYGQVPDRSGAIDEWLFLMQHFGAPTRLLDWTESDLIALFFALHDRQRTSDDIDEKEGVGVEDGAIWVLHPLELNKLPDSIGLDRFPNTWSDHEGNVVRYNLQRPFGLTSVPTKYPIAIQATFGTLVMALQKSCFTVHGNIEHDFETLFSGTLLEKNGYFRKYSVPLKSKIRLAQELDCFGITRSTVFPDLEGLATELKPDSIKDDRKTE